MATTVNPGTDRAIGWREVECGPDRDACHQLLCRVERSNEINFFTPPPAHTHTHNRRLANHYHFPSILCVYLAVAGFTKAPLQIAHIC
jgi:hypothetical protein